MVKKATTEKVKKAPAKKAAPKTAKVKDPASLAGKEKKPKAEKVEKAAEKKVEAVAAEAPKAKNNEKYFYAVGRRKSSVAQVRIFEDEKVTDAELLVNGKKMKDYFPAASLQNNLLAPLKAAGTQGKFRFSAIVRGGGVTGQVEAVRLGIARALVKYDESLKKSLKDLGLMTRDSRKVERKKAGLKKARKAPQWAKR